MKNKEIKNKTEEEKVTEKSLQIVEKKHRLRKIKEFIKNKVLRNTMQTMLLILVLIGLFIGLNFWVNKLELSTIDITKEKLYSLSEDSKNQISKIETETYIYLFGFEENATIIDLAKQYTKTNKKIKAEKVDLSQRMDLAEKYGVTSNDTGIVVESGERHKIISSYDMYTYDYTTYQTIDISEEKITNAIIETTIAKKPKIYFLTGHGEYTINSEITILRQYLQNEANDIEILDLLIKETVPEDTELLIIASPAQDITEYEAQIIINYINKGGKILSLQDPTTKGKYTNLQKIYDLFGVTVENGIVMEQDNAKMLLQTPNFIIPTLGNHTITEKLEESGGIVIPNSGRLSIVNSEEYENLGITVNKIIETTEKAFFRTNLNIQTMNKANTEEEGRFTLGAEINKTINENTTSTLILYANGMFISDIPVSVGQQNICMIYLRNNRDFILNTTAYLTKREDTIRIRKDTGTVTYTSTEQEDNIVKIIIFTVPILIIITGIVVWQIRRRKK